MVCMPETSVESLTEGLSAVPEAIDSLIPAKEDVLTEEYKAAGLIIETGGPVEIWPVHEEEYYNAIKVIREGLLGREPEKIDTETLESLKFVLTAWEFAHTRAIKLYHTHPSSRDFDAEELWDGLAATISEDLAFIFSPRMPLVNVGAWENPSRVYVTKKLLESSDFEQKSILTEYMAYRVWLSHQPVTFQSYSDEARRDPKTGKTPSEIRAELTRESYMEVLSLGLVESAKAGDTVRILRALSLLLSSEAKDIADTALRTGDLDEDVRLQFAVDYINTFGFVSCVDVISPLAKTHPEFKKLYETINGREVEEVVQAVSELYTKSLNEFMGHYAPEVTEREVGLTKSVLLSQAGKSLEEATVLDLAAGFGRVSSALVAAGCKNVVSVEPQDDFLERLNTLAEQADGRLRVVRGVWDNLSELGVEKADLGICVGRSLPHANTVPKLVRALSQMTATCDNWLVDFPDPAVGIYKTNSDNLLASLVSLGIDPEKTPLLHDSPDGRHFCNRMIVNEDQLKMLGELLGFTVEVVDEDSIGENNDIRNVYYLLKKDPNFDVTELCGDRLMAITADLDLRRPGTDFNMYIPAWGMSLGQALIYSHEEPAFRDVKIASIIRNNARFGVPKVSSEFDENGVLYLEVTGWGSER